MDDRVTSAPVSEGLPAAYRLSGAYPRGTHAHDLPRCVFVEVTNRCNLACEACVRTYGAEEVPRDLSYDEFMALAAQFPAMERAVLHGIGEPLLNRELPMMIRYLKQRGITVLFNSNGTLLDEYLQDALVLSGLDEFRLSLDSADAATYALLRGKDLFDQVVANVRGLVATKASLGMDTPRVSIWSIGMKDTLDQLPALIRLAAELGVPEVYLQRLVYRLSPDEPGTGDLATRAVYGNMTTPESELVAECGRLSAALGVELKGSGACDAHHSLVGAQGGGRRPWHECRRPWTTAYITANGNALPCCIAPFATADYHSLIMGNVWSSEFASIWNDEPYRLWRKGLLGAHPPEPCSGCGVHWSL